MFIRRTLVASFAAMSFAAQAHEPPTPPAVLGGIVQERDVRLVFDFLHEALNAAVEGREAQPPEELARRAEVVAEEVKRRGAAAGHAILDQIEAHVRRAMRP